VSQVPLVFGEARGSVFAEGNASQDTYFYRDGSFYCHEEGSAVQMPPPEDGDQIWRVPRHHLKPADDQLSHPRCGTLEERPGGERRVINHLPAYIRCQKTPR